MYSKISSGTAAMIQNNILTESEIEEGLVLTCQAVPQSPSITVDFDDVWVYQFINSQNNIIYINSSHNIFIVSWRFVSIR